MKIRTLVADDEPSDRKALVEFLSADPEIELVAECENGRQAIAAFHKQDPHLLFLNVQMPELDGFEVVRAIGPSQLPATVFVTGYDRHWLYAFEMCRLDFLLKPLTQESLLPVLRRAKGHLGQPSAHSDRLLALLREVRNPAYQERLAIRSGGRIIFLKGTEIDWIQAEGNYVRLHAGKQSYLHRETMNVLHAKLDPRLFVRIHRSTIVSVEKIRELRPWPTGEYVVVMENGKELTLSRGYREQLPLLLGEAR
jgi:two-component system LytT family response regulator